MALVHHHRTARLTLRPVAPSDEAAVVCGIGDIAVSGWLSTVPHPYRAEDFRYFLNEIAVSGETFVLEDQEGFAAHFVGEGGTLASGYFAGNLRSARVCRDRRFCKALGIERPHVITHLTREAFG